MFALGQNRTFPRISARSALTPKADINAATQYVRLVPIADIQLRRVRAATKKIQINTTTKPMRWISPSTA